MTWWHYAGLAATAALEYVCYSGIATFAAASYNEKGELVDGGADLKMKGLCGYYHDLLYLTIIVQVAACLSNWAWYIYLSVPGYGLWKLTELVLIPYFKSSTQAEPKINEAMQKKMDRTEQRAERRRMKSFR